MLMVAGLLAGCASMQNTPAQDATWEKLNRCPKVAGNVQVNTDGSWHVYGDRAGVMALEQCWLDGLKDLCVMWRERLYALDNAHV